MDTVEELKSYIARNKRFGIKKIVSEEFICYTTILDEKELYKYLLLISASFYSVHEFYMQNKINAKYTSVPVLKKREEFYKSNIDNFAVVSDIRKIIEHYWTRDDLYFQKCFSYHNRTLFYTKNDKEIALIDNLQKVSDLFLTLMFLE